jgi:quercetin dioxygenase-like cupin family protein
MSFPTALRRTLQFSFAVAAFMALGSTGSAEWDPSAIHITPPDQIPWKDNGASATAILAGDPSKPGIYVELTKWHAGHMSRPHTHPNDRYIYVISGTWWVGTGPKYDPNITKPMTPGSYVVHPAGGIHWDGAKDADCVIEIVGMGPATSTPAEQK